MLHKLLKIKGVGKFWDYSPVCFKCWNGVFEQSNAIYADNGSGKTTFTQILKSASGVDSQLLGKRRSFGYTDLISVIFLDGHNKEIKFDGNTWTTNIPQIEIFDSFYVEDNIYVISLARNQYGDSYKVVLGADVVNCLEQINILKESRKKQTNYRSNISKKIKKETDLSKVKKYKTCINSSIALSKKINQQILQLEKQIESLNENVDYLERINYYLELFSPDIKLSKLDRKRNNVIVYNIDIHGHHVREGVNSPYSLRQVLSEGEKNALSLSFFLAKIDLADNLKDKIIVFDDPISSMDNMRRTVTLNILNRLSRSCAQFFLLSHDINFIKEFYHRNCDTQVLKLSNDGITSYLQLFDVDAETLTGVFKDIVVLQDFIDNHNRSKYSPRDVVRCIRPVLEAFLRIKYFGIFDDSMWLGDFIQAIRNSKDGDILALQKKNLCALSDINDYSKQYHHSNPNCLEVPLSENELLLYCKRTIDLLHNL